jgi:ATP-dependent DNA helicase RecG
MALPDVLKARIPGIGTKPRKEVLRALIRDLCAWREFSARDMADLLGGRDHKHLVREFLTPMVAEGLLACTIPAMENHPDQRYTLPADIPSPGGAPS